MQNLKTFLAPDAPLHNGGSKDVIAVVGAGTMGNGIAHVFAQAGYQVQLVDLNPSQLQRAQGLIAKNLDRQVARSAITEQQKADTLRNIQFNPDFAQAVGHARLVIEATPEDIELKKDIFQELDVNAPKDCILATNTSSISITKIARFTHRPGQVIGMHFMNPVPVMKLVEIINGYSTKKEVTGQVIAYTNELGKIPCVVKDYPGFIANRILMPMINEAIYSLYEGVAAVQEIDTVMKLGMAHPMGPLQLADFIGLDTCLNIMRVLHDGFGNPKYAPCPLLVNMVTAGNLGVKSGEGFYQYTEGNKELIVSSSFTS